MSNLARCVDERNIVHLLIGLNREDIESLLRGEVLTLLRGDMIPLSAKSGIALLFAETDEEVEERLPPAMPIN